MVTRTRITADEFLAMERDEFDTRRYELVDGEVVVNAPVLWHQHVSLEIAGTLRAWAQAERGRGVATIWIDVKLDQYNVYEPDVLWYAQDRAPSLTDRPPYPIPGLAVEVRSPSTWRKDVGRKKAVYDARGVGELWLVDFTAVLVYRRSGPKQATFDVELELAPEETLTSPLLPGFALPLARLYPEG